MNISNEIKEYEYYLIVTIVLVILAVIIWTILIAVDVEYRGGWGDTGSAILIIGFPFLLLYLLVTYKNVFNK